MLWRVIRRCGGWRPPVLAERCGVRAALQHRERTPCSCTLEVCLYVQCHVHVVMWRVGSRVSTVGRRDIEPSCEDDTIIKSFS